MVRAPRPDQHAKITPEPDGRKGCEARVEPSRTRPLLRESFPRDRVDGVRLEAAMLRAKLGGNALMRRPNTVMNPCWTFSLYPFLPKMINKFPFFQQAAFLQMLRILKHSLLSFSTC